MLEIITQLFSTIKRNCPDNSTFRGRAKNKKIEIDSTSTVMYNTKLSKDRDTCIPRKNSTWTKGIRPLPK
ncbi:hypothetical protein JTB14_029419 [Gonioctena quinquepunctata]|nr:hypothetical protein JTB14_029419 [Gonioctena quinquepunctata]